jgi:D-serine/D-alanine/glycine transporter
MEMSQTALPRTDRTPAVAPAGTGPGDGVGNDGSGTNGAGTSTGPGPKPGLQRGLANRHLQLIAIGGAIGTGLFMGSGKTIHLAGPSVLLVYLIIGVMLFFVMRAMGELLLSNLHYKSFRDVVADLLGPAWGFVAGWTYWFCWIVTGTADIVVISGYVRFWWADLPSWIPSLATVVLLFALNLVAVRLFGELEFWFAVIKVVAIIGLVLLGVGMVFLHHQAPDGTVAAWSNLVSDGGLFPHGFTGFLAAFQIALFAFVGIELAGTAAAETKDPEHTLPRAINTIPIRIILFYVCALAVIMTVTPWRHVVADASPFVQMFALAGLPAAAGIVNFVVLTSAASSANSGLYSTTRMLYALGLEGTAPRPWGRLNGRGIPARGLVFSACCLLPGVALVYAGTSVMAAFTLVTTVASVLFMVVWSLILISYLVYRRRRPQLHRASTFRVPGGSAICVVVLAFFAAMVVVLLMEPDTRWALLFTPIWFAVLGVAWWMLRRRQVSAPVRTPIGAEDGQAPAGRDAAADRGPDPAVAPASPADDAAPGPDRASADTQSEAQPPLAPDPDDIDPLALVLVVEHRKTREGEAVAGAEDIFDAAAAGIDRILRSDDPRVQERVRAWNSDKIRKIVKRARNKAWSDILALDLPHLVAEAGDARVAVFAPLRPSEYPQPLARAQVSGLEAPHRRGPLPAALRVHVDPALHMSTGKTVAQLGHAVQLFAVQCPDAAAAWRAQGARVDVVAGIPDGPLAVVVHDAGYTEVPPGSLTAAIAAEDVPPADAPGPDAAQGAAATDSSAAADASAVADVLPETGRDGD